MKTDKIRGNMKIDRHGMLPLPLNKHEEMKFLHLGHWTGGRNDCGGILVVAVAVY